MKEIVQDGDTVLRGVAKSVPEELFGSAELSHLISEMTEALDVYPEGVALAAPQVGVSWRLFIVRKDRTLPVSNQGQTLNPNSKGLTLVAAHAPNQQPATSKPDVQIYVNPEIVKTSRKRAKADEGCLSVHGVYGTTNRHERVTIKARGADGSHIMRGAGGLMAQIFEHEIDHLNGILFTDHAEHLIRIPHGSAHPFAYFGTPKVSSDTLAVLIERGFVPSVVITSVDAPKGRGLALAQSETKSLALANNIPVITPSALDENTINDIKVFECEYAVCVAYGKIFSQELIDVFPKGVLNVHYSLLPKYRGATPLETALLNGETETGVTIQKMVRELDAGDIIAQEAIMIGGSETARELRPRLIELGANLLADTIPEYLEDKITPAPQDASRATRAYKIKKGDGELSLDAPSKENWNKYRAYADSVGTFFLHAGRRVKITKASFSNGKFTVERVIPEGKREMAYVGKLKA